MTQNKRDLCDKEDHTIFTRAFVPLLALITPALTLPNATLCEG